jgi:hypothetical protein
MGCHTQKQGGPGAVKGRRCKAKRLCKQEQLEQLEQHKIQQVNLSMEAVLHIIP